MKLSEMLKKAEDKLKNEDDDLITAPWQTTSLKKGHDRRSISENNKETKTAESSNNVGTDIGTKATESDKLKINKIYYYVQNLSGIQLTLMHYIWSVKFQDNKRYYAYLNTNTAALESGIGTDKLRISLRRIESKNILIRESGVMGRHGFSIFYIPNDVIRFFDQCHLNKSENKNNITIYNSNINAMFNFFRSKLCGRYCIA